MLALVPWMAVAAGLPGTVTGVTDGDSLWWRAQGAAHAMRLRLYGVDAPERCQALGEPARQALLQKVQGRVVQAELLHRDDYGRTLARLWVDGEDVGASLVAAGWAWSYRWRDDRGPYVAQEVQARLQALGVFAQGDALHPRDFRRRYGACAPQTGQSARRDN